MFIFVSTFQTLIFCGYIRCVFLKRSKLGKVHVACFRQFYKHLHLMNYLSAGQKACSQTQTCISFTFYPRQTADILQNGGKRLSIHAVRLVTQVCISTIQTDPAVFTHICNCCRFLLIQCQAIGIDTNTKSFFLQKA